MYPAKCAMYSEYRLHKTRHTACSKVEVVLGSESDARHLVLRAVEVVRAWRRTPIALLYPS
jgi:hypothetical protein